jgi:hypothetical protein
MSSFFNHFQLGASCLLLLHLWSVRLTCKVQVFCATSALEVTYKYIFEYYNCFEQHYQLPSYI